MLRTLVWLNLILVASFSIPARSHASALKRLMILDTPVCATLLKSMTGIREALRESEGPLDQEGRLRERGVEAIRSLSRRVGAEAGILERDDFRSGFGVVGDSVPSFQSPRGVANQIATLVTDVTRGFSPEHSQLVSDSCSVEVPQQILQVLSAIRLEMGDVADRGHELRKKALIRLLFKDSWRDSGFLAGFVLGVSKVFPPAGDGGLILFTNEAESVFRKIEMGNQSAWIHFSGEYLLPSESLEVLESSGALKPEKFEEGLLLALTSKVNSLRWRRVWIDLTLTAQENGRPILFMASRVYRDEMNFPSGPKRGADEELRSPTWVEWFLPGLAPARPGSRPWAGPQRPNR